MLECRTVRKELETILTLARSLPVDSLPQLIGALAEANAVALARLTVPTVATQPDRLLDVTEASRRMHVSPDYLYRHSDKLPFTRRMGTKLLFSSVGLDSYLRRAK
jgi:hypothetical protein